MSPLLDPIPTTLLVKHLEELLPSVTRIINLSLDTGYFTDHWKLALVRPLLKKDGLEPVLKNYRPVSNLQYISKLVETVVVRQLQKYLSSNNLFPVYQSAYRHHHSTETALLKVVNDILLNMDKQRVTLLLLVDLSAAFDTVEHDTLLCKTPSVFKARCFRGSSLTCRAVPSAYQLMGHSLGYLIWNVVYRKGPFFSRFIRVDCSTLFRLIFQSSLLC